MLAALVNGVKGGKWHSLIDKVYRPSTLYKAWEAVRRNRGAAGVDKVKVDAFQAKLDDNIAKLSSDLKQGKYVPKPVKRVEIPKGPGQTRPLGIPCVRDRIVQKAVLMVIEPIFENQFLDMSYGFRPGRGARAAVVEVERLIAEGYVHVLDADIKGYFDSIPHDKLMDRVKEHISDRQLLAILESWLQQDIMTEVDRWKPMSGTPQGAVISPLLANLYLHSLDLYITSKGYKMVRYADDFVVMTKTANEARAAQMFVEAWVERNGLTLHPDKVHRGNCLKRGKGFEFLGFKFEARKRSIRKKSLTKFQDNVRALTRRNSGVSLDSMIGALNLSLRGWFNYFKGTSSSVFHRLDGFIRRRLRARLLRMHKRKGIGKSKRCHKQWPNSFFAKAGLFTLAPANAKAKEDARSLFDGI
jgi:RNA-directed DNA polymerase